MGKVDAMSMVALGLAASGGGGGSNPPIEPGDAGKVLKVNQQETGTYWGDDGNEPDAYIKSASVDNKTLTLTKKDNSTVTFTDTGSVVSGTNDGTNWSTITIDGTTKAIPAGGGSTDDCVKMVPQVISDAQFTQAMTNLGLGAGRTTASYLGMKISNVSVTGSSSSPLYISSSDGTYVQNGTAGNIKGRYYYWDIIIKLNGSNYTLSNVAPSLLQTNGPWFQSLNFQVGSYTVTQVRFNAWQDVGSVQLFFNSPYPVSSDIFTEITLQGHTPETLYTKISSNYVETLANTAASSGGIYVSNNTANCSGAGTAIAFIGGSGTVDVSSQGATAIGMTSTNQGLKANNMGALALGCSTALQGIRSEGMGSFAGGYSGYSSGLRADSTGSLVFGYADSGNMYASGKGSVCVGVSDAYLGSKTVALGSIAAGYNIKAGNVSGQCAVGRNNIEDNAKQFIVGIGTNDSNRANGFTLDTSGNGVFAGTVTPSGADYAEYFEWEDGNPDNEDRMGYIVTLNTEGKIVLANASDDVLGITSATKSVIGDSQEMNWVGKYVRDKWGRIIYDTEVIHHPEVVDPVTGEIIEPAWDEEVKAPRISPEYDPTREYKPRSKRKEWYPVGMLGKVITRYSGELSVGNYVSANNGIAVLSSTKTNMRVIEVIDEETVRILVR